MAMRKLAVDRRPAWPGAGAARKGPWAGLSALNGGQAQACNGTEGDQRQDGMCLTRRAWEMHAETNHPPGRKAPQGVARPARPGPRSLPSSAGHDIGRWWAYPAPGLWARTSRKDHRERSQRSDRLAVLRIPAPRTLMRPGVPLSPGLNPAGSVGRAGALMRPGRPALAGPRKQRRATKRCGVHPWLGFLRDFLPCPRPRSRPCGRGFSSPMVVRRCARRPCGAGG